MSQMFFRALLSYILSEWIVSDGLVRKVTRAYVSLWSLPSVSHMSDYFYLSAKPLHLAFFISACDFLALIMYNTQTGAEL